MVKTKIALFLCIAAVIAGCGPDKYKAVEESIDARELSRKFDECIE